jgi:16S rRNA (guanine966-N2)-methyltransferase
MRVIAGSLKGRQLKSPTWAGLRPTSDKLRETIFNILAPRIAGARVLDGYAGTGALGIEALSRGAASVTFIESDRRAQRLVADNLARCGITERYVIIRDSVARAVAALAAAVPPASFDIVLLDPPYDAAVADALVSGELLAGNGILVLEHARRRRVPPAAGTLALTREVAAGDSALALYACRPEPSTPAPSTRSPTGTSTSSRAAHASSTGSSSRS